MLDKETGVPTQKLPRGIHHFTRNLFACLAIGLATSAQAQFNIVVNDLRDLHDYDLTDGMIDADNVAGGNQITVRAAIENANLFGGWVIIQLGATVYILDHWGTDDVGKFGDLDIYSGLLTRLTIQGVPGATTIDAIGFQFFGAPDRVLHITSTVNANAVIELKDLQLTNGQGVALGAGIRHDAGKLELTNVSISRCWANNQGGGIHSSALSPGWLKITGGAIGLDNRAVFDGGGIYLATPAITPVELNGVSISGNLAGTKGGGLRLSVGSAATLTGCMIGNNTADSGAGISNRGALIVNGGSLAGNVAVGTGGGLANDIGASLSIDGAVISNNTAGIGGGLNISAPATLSTCTIHTNTATTGGGINNTGSDLRVLRSTLRNNTATGPFGGGGIRGFGRLSMVNSTISGNRANAGRGGGIYFDGGIFTAELSATTIAFNSAGGPGAGIYTDSGFGITVFTIIGTLIANNNTIPPAFLPFNFAGGIPLTSAGFNLDTDGTCGLAAPGDQSNVAALLGPLQNNGGPTETHALMPGSPAINQGSCSDVNGMAIRIDQRGVMRAAPCDVGAYEAPAGSPPGNNNCAGAIQIASPGVINFSNTNATTDGPPGACGFTGVQNLDSDVWFVYQGPCHGFAIFTLNAVPSGLFNPLIEAYPGCPPAPSLGCGGGFPGPISLTLQIFAGATYVIRAGGQNGAQGNLVLSITQNCNCPADIFPPPTGNNVVDIDDLVLVITHWGACPQPCPPYCLGDVNHNCLVNIDDLVQVITNWGACP